MADPEIIEDGIPFSESRCHVNSGRALPGGSIVGLFQTHSKPGYRVGELISDRIGNVTVIGRVSAAVMGIGLEHRTGLTLVQQERRGMEVARPLTPWLRQPSSLASVSGPDGSACWGARIARLAGSWERAG